MKYLNSPLGIFFQRCIVFLLIPIIGWGHDDISGFTADYSRTGWLILATLINGYVAWYYAKRRNPKKTKNKIIVKRQHLVIAVFRVIMFLLLISIPFFSRRNLFCFEAVAVLQFAGLIISGGSLIIMFESKKYLGVQFSGDVRLIENHSLLTGGFYKFIRHPRYLGHIAFMTGFSLLFNVWAGFILTFIMLLILLWRINEEEKMLADEFGEEWKEYHAKTKKIIPFVY